MLKRSDGEYILTDHNYFLMDSGMNHPAVLALQLYNFYDGESGLYLRFSDTQDKWWMHDGIDGCEIDVGDMKTMTLEEARKKIKDAFKVNDQPLPSENVEASTTNTPEVSLAESKLDEILRRLAKLEQGASC